MTTKILRDILVDALHKALSKSEQQVTVLKKEVDVLRYHLYKCRNSAYRAFTNTSGVLPSGYEAGLDSLEAQQAKKAKAKK